MLVECPLWVELWPLAIRLQPARSGPSRISSKADRHAKPPLQRNVTVHPMITWLDVGRTEAEQTSARSCGSSYQDS